jgi:hypothetical protein
MTDTPGMKNIIGHLPILCFGGFKNGKARYAQLGERQTFNPIFSSLSGTDIFPYVEAIMMDLPDLDGPKSLDKSTLMISFSP